ncbi:MAG TPA: Wadjet anti-phage system protein JetD domain-containing protein [Anaerolineae bacterium]|nr:Wadjet anti-phage system protein JetD domain-containing protein [Anaerolineae bacterium]
MTAPRLNFTPSADVAAVLHDLLDAYERRQPRPDAHAERPTRSIRYSLERMSLPGYHSQVDPAPRQIANEQLQQLERLGLVKLDWLPGETGHLLASVTLVPEGADALFAWLGRTPEAVRRARLLDSLLGERFRFDGWRLTAVQGSIDQIKAGKSPSPFSLADEAFNRDLLTALAALDQVKEETPYRVFSVRVFNDSKRLEDVLGALCTLARRGNLDWREWSNDEILRELSLTANPTHIYLHGPWRLVDDAGQVISLGEFDPSVGLPAAQAHHVRRVSVEAGHVVCVENPTAFYELVRHAKGKPTEATAFSSGRLAAICLWGNPSPACRHLLRRLVAELPEVVPLYVWADIDYGGLNILAHLREQVSPRFEPYRMDVETLEAHARWARPLASSDARNLNRLAGRASLADMRSLLFHMLERGLKLEQEAIILGSS